MFDVVEYSVIQYSSFLWSEHQKFYLCESSLKVEQFLEIIAYNVSQLTYRATASAWIEMSDFRQHSPMQVYGIFWRKKVSNFLTIYWNNFKYQGLQQIQDKEQVDSPEILKKMFRILCSRLTPETISNISTTDFWGTYQA